MFELSQHLCHRLIIIFLADAKYWEASPDFCVMGSPVEGAACCVSDILSWGCTAPWTRKGDGQPAPQQNGILNVEIAPLNSLRVSMSPLDVNFEGDLAKPNKLGKLSPRGSDKSSQGHSDLKQPRLAPRPQSSVPSISRTQFGHVSTFIFV